MKKILVTLCLVVASVTGVYAQKSPVVTNTFWDNWYLQLGFDMSLQNPYGKNFSQVFPKGKTFGFDFAAGKWFSPELGLRVRLNWENGIKLFKNDHLEWVANAEDGTPNIDKGGYLVMNVDVPINLSSIIGGYDETRKWNVVVFPRAGLTSNRAIKSGSPMVGVGAGCIYRLKDRWNLYAETAYQVTTSEFFSGVSGTGMSVSSGSNGFFNFEVGVQYNLGSKGGMTFDRLSSY